MCVMTKQVCIVAVSGGLDSTVLLHMLMNGRIQGYSPESFTIRIAHVNHGIRPSSSNDEDFVRRLAEKYNLAFDVCRLELGPDCSEEQARTARYGFLDGLLKKNRTNILLLAHHKDDVFETAIINILRGTGRRGLTSLTSRASRVRPLLGLTKQDLRDYAITNQLEWCEDESNNDTKYLRNYVRIKIIPMLSEESKVKIETILQRLKTINTDLDELIATILQYKRTDKGVVRRRWFIQLEHSLACEFMYAITRQLRIENIDRPMVERLVVALKAARVGKCIVINDRVHAIITKRNMRFVEKNTGKTLNV